MNTKHQPNNYSPQPYFIPGEEESFDFKRYISLFISNWYWFAITLFMSLSIAYGINRWSEKMYTVSSTLLIKDDRFAGTAAGLSNIFPGGEAYKNQQNLNNEIGILRSFSLNYRIMKEMPDFHVVYVKVGKRGIAETRMYNENPFIVRYGSLSEQTMNYPVTIRILSEERYLLRMNSYYDFEKEMRFGEQFNEMGFNFSIEPRNNDYPLFNPDGSNRYYFYFVSPASMANRYRSSLSVNPIAEEASLVTLSTTGPVKEQEADYLNKLMEVYIQQGLELKNQTAERTIGFIDDQLGVISDSLALAEGDMESFRLGNRLIDISQEGSLIQSKLEQIENEKTRLMLQKRYYEYLQHYIESKNESGDIVAPSVMGVTDPLLMSLVSELSLLQKQKMKLGMNLDESLEPVRFLDESVLSVKKAIGENIASGLENIDEITADADRRLRQVETSLNRLPSIERKLINIQRKFDLNNTVYTFLLEKKAEAGIARAANVPDNRIIDYAGSYSTSMIKPKPRQNYLIALLLGLLIPVTGILVIDALNNKIIDKRDVEKRTAAPVIGYVSHNSLKTELPVVENPGSSLSESFRSVRTNLKYFLKDKTCPVISVSSTITAEGKTFVSVNLAAIIAMSGKKVLLVGLDLRKPRLHRIFSQENDDGLSSYLIGEQKFEGVIKKTDIDNLWYVNAGPVPPNPAELIESASMGEFMEKAKKKFDYIILDTPPVAIVTDTLLVSAITDFYLFIVRQRYTSKNTIELVDELYRNESIKSLGIVINDISISGYYGYGLRYGYSMGYGYNYGYNYYSQYGKYGYSDSAKGYYTEDS
ncbi:MAG: polysaccharide biosynthesis tyrosine autokinase [Candidatus Latescibacteria bacterium]|nr:polysaccharide biosynthesis tyrosine autokinase [Candidatus Latescibacterota bacterium]